MSTIAAISTPLGRSAVGIVRLSGPDALAVAQKISKATSQFTARHATLTSLWDTESDELIDEALVTYFEAPASVTGEDVVEIACHGSPVVLTRVLELALLAGCRVAGPGEFTLRALMNGKLSLSQAEAIRDLINAQTEAAARQAARQANGELALRLRPLQEGLIETIVLLESAVEFVEDDLPAVELERIEKRIELVRSSLQVLVLSYRAGKLLANGIHVSIVGPPNVGKSSIFNRLLTNERAIVTPIPGTTRDTLTDTVDMDGVPVVLTDTAGLREASDTVETLGIERTHRAMADSDLVLLVFDGSQEDAHGPTSLLDQTQAMRRVIVRNKCDLPSFVASDSEINVSALTGEGFDQLRAAILDCFDFDESSAQELVITNARHCDLLRSAIAQLDQARAALGTGASEEIIVTPLHDALKFLGQITGETTPNDILSQIFSTFCIGK